MDRPIRLRHDGQVESYDLATNQWLLDRSRDPRENIPLAKPPVIPSAMGVAKVNAVNSMVYQLKNVVAHMVDWSGSATDPELYNIATTVFGITDIATRAGIKIVAGDAVPSFDNPFYNNLAYVIASQFYKFSGYADLFTTSAWEWLLCKLWCSMNADNSFDFETYVALVDDIYENAASHFSDGAETIHLLLILLGRKGLTNLGYLTLNVTTTGDPATDCGPCA